MKAHKIGVIVEEYERESTGETVQAITFIMDAYHRELFDQIKQKNPKYEDDVMIVNDAIIEGINALIAYKRK